jgi:hypothetical protein
MIVYAATPCKYRDREGNMARWFGPKVAGFGVGPKGWQGWTVTALFLGAMVSVRYINLGGFGLPHWTEPAAILTILAGYLALVYFKYEDD